MLNVHGYLIVFPFPNLAGPGKPFFIGAHVAARLIFFVGTRVAALISLQQVTVAVGAAISVRRKTSRLILGAYPIIVLGVTSVIARRKLYNPLLWACGTTQRIIQVCRSN